MIHKFLWTVCVLYLMCCSNDKHSYPTGTYKVTKNISFPISTLTQSEINAFLGKQVTFFYGSAVFEKDTCKINEVQIDTLTTEEYFGQLKTDVEKATGIKLPQILIGRSLYCNGQFWNSFPNHFFYLSNKIMLTIKDGEIFILHKVE